MESQFDIAVEIAFVVDVARGAMRAFRQFLEPAHTGLRPAAAWAQQIPAHSDNSLPRRGEEQFDRMVRRDGPYFCERNWANASERADRRMPQEIAKLRREAMRGGILLQLRRERLNTAADRRLREILDARPRDVCWIVALPHKPFDRSQR